MSGFICVYLSCPISNFSTPPKSYQCVLLVCWHISSVPRKIEFYNDRAEELSNKYFFFFFNFLLMKASLIFHLARALLFLTGLSEIIITSTFCKYFLKNSNKSIDSGKKYVSLSVLGFLKSFFFVVLNAYCHLLDTSHH